MKKLLIAIYFFIVLALIYFSFPGLLALGKIKKYGTIYTQNYDQRGFTFFPAVPSSAITATYRGSAARTGEAKENFRFRDLKIKWQSLPFNVGVHSASKSSPVVDSSGIYVGADTGWIYAFDHSGNIRWQYFVGGAARGIHGSGLLDENYLYIGAYNGNLYCFEKLTGKMMWIRDLGDAIGSSPLMLDSETLIVTSETSTIMNGRMSAIRRATGEVLWQSPWVGEQVHSSPTWDEKEEVLVYGANNGQFSLINPQTGKRTGQFKVEKPIKGTAAIQKSIAYWASWTESLYAFDLKNKKIKWEVKLVGSSQSSAALIEKLDMLIVAGGRARERTAIYGIKMSTGAIVWQLDNDPKSTALGSSTVAYSPNRGLWLSFTPCQTKHLCVIDARQGRVLQKVELSGPVTGEPVLFNGKIFVATNGGGVVVLE